MILYWKRGQLSSQQDKIHLKLSEVLGPITIKSNNQLQKFLQIIYPLWGGCNASLLQTDP